MSKQIPHALGARTNDLSCPICLGENQYTHKRTDLFINPDQTYSRFSLINMTVKNCWYSSCDGKTGKRMCLPSSKNRKQLEQHPVAEWYPGRRPAANVRPLVAPKRCGERQQCRPVCVWSIGDERLHSFHLLSGSRHWSSEHVQTHGYSPAHALSQWEWGSVCFCVVHRTFPWLLSCSWSLRKQWRFLFGVLFVGLQKK